MKKEKVIPFKNKEEFMKAWEESYSLPRSAFMKYWDLYYSYSPAKKSDIRLKVRGETNAQHVECVTDKGLLFANSNKIMNWTEALARCYFLDGTKCGQKIKVVDDSKRYRPFQSPQEFLQFYHFTCGELSYGSFESTLCCSGIWLKTENNIFENVVSLGDDGLRIAHSDGVVTWEKLYNRYNFLDGSVCGVLNLK